MLRSFPLHLFPEDRVKLPWGRVQPAWPHRSLASPAPSLDSGIHPAHVFASVFLSSRGSATFQGDQPHGGQCSPELPDVARQGGECGVPHQPVQLQQYHRARGRQKATARARYACQRPLGNSNSSLSFMKKLRRLGRWFGGYEHFLCKHENPGSRPQHRHKKWAMVKSMPISPELLRVETRGSLKLAGRQPSPGSMSSLVSQRSKVESNRTPGIFFQLACTDSQTHTQAYAHVHTQTHTIWM